MRDYLKQREKRKEQRYLEDLKRRRLVLVWAVQRIVEEIARLEGAAHKMSPTEGEE